ncbi:hypothetical protein FQR65_LT13427 [Abscondita terminalis]|nr:hypothetical protein FQR65_LT13427 [Abscondita terminalis]
MSFLETVPQARSGISNIEHSVTEMDESTQRTDVDIPEDTEQSCVTDKPPQLNDNDRQTEINTESENKPKHRRIKKEQDPVLNYLEAKEKSRQQHTQIMARQEVFQTLTKYQMIALETDLRVDTNYPNVSRAFPDIPRTSSSLSSTNQEIDLFTKQQLLGAN